MIDLETIARTFDAVFEACQPEPDARHAPVRIDEFEDDEHAQTDLRERIRDARA